MNQINHNEEENNPVKKALSALPKVNVSEDFEHRLQRRLTQREPESVFFGKFSQSRFVPAFAYSLVGLIAVGVVSYYVFIRTGVNVRATSPPAESSQAVQSDTARSVLPQQDQLISNEPSSASKNLQENVILEKRTEPDDTRSESFAKQTEKKDTDIKEAEIDETRQMQSVQTGSTGTADKVNQLKEEANIRQTPTVQPSAKSTLPAFTVPNVQGIQSQGVMSAQQTSLTDSLRKDSLQKAQQKMLFQQKAKTKKPF